MNYILRCMRCGKKTLVDEIKKSCPKCNYSNSVGLTHYEIKKEVKV